MSNCNINLVSISKVIEFTFPSNSKPTSFQFVSGATNGNQQGTIVFVDGTTSNISILDDCVANGCTRTQTFSGNGKVISSFKILGSDTAGSTDYWLFDSLTWSAGDGLNWYQKNDAGTSASIANSLSSTTSDYTSCGIDPTINDDWGSGATTCLSGRTDYFTNYWTGYIMAPVTGTLTFSVQSDDGFKLEIDGTAVITDMESQGAAGSNSSGSMNATGTFSATAGTSYTIKVWHHEDAGGASARLYWSYSGQTIQIVPQDYLYSSNPGSSVSTPGAPTSVSGTRANASVALSWTAPTSDGGAAISGYKVEYSSNSGSTWTSATNNTGSTSTSYTATGLTNGTAYIFRVSAINSAGTGTASSNSSAVTPSTTPGAPTSVAGTAGNAQVALTWTAPTSTGGAAISGYKIEYSANNGSSWTTATSNTGSTSTSYTATGLTNLTTYLFKVSAINVAGTGTASSNSASITPGAQTPTISSHPASSTRTAGQSVTFSVSASVTDGGTLSYQWKKNGTNVGTNSASYTISTVSSSSADTYTVTVTNTKNSTTASVTSNIASLTIVGAPTAPQNVTLSSNSQSAGRLRITWDAPASNGGSVVTEYEYRYSLSTEESWSLWASTTDTTTVVTGLGNSKSYKAQVRAKNAYGTSASAVSGIASTSGESASLLGAPTISSVVAETSTGSRLRVTFVEVVATGVNAVTSYQYSTDSGVSWKTLTFNNAGSPIFDVTTVSSSTSSLVNGTTYTILVRAVNAAGGGTASNGVSAVPSKAPGVPTSVALSLGSAGSMNLAYSAPSDTGGLALTYEYQYKLTSDSIWSGWISIGAGTSVTISGITNGNTYDARVRARNTTGVSDASSTATLNTVIAVGPTITRQPSNLSLTTGQTTSTSLNVAATAGAGETLSYQWYKNGSAISGATSETFTVTTNAASGDAGTYYAVVTASKSGTSANVSAKIDAIGSGTLCNAPNSNSFFYGSRFYAGTADTVKEFQLQFAAGTSASVLATTVIRFFRAAGTNGRHYPDAGGTNATRASTTPTDYQVAGQLTYASISNNVAVFRGDVALPAAGHYWWVVINTTETRVSFCNSNTPDTSINGWYPYKEGSSWIWFGSFRQNLDGGKFSWSTHPNYRLFTSTTTTTSSTSTTSSSVTVTVNPAPTISTSSVPGATKGSAYSTTLAASGGTAPYTWRLANGSALPAGLSLSTSGVISGTPTALDLTSSSSSSSGSLINGGFTSNFASSPSTGWFQARTVGGRTVINTTSKTLQFSFGAPACTNQATAAMSEVQQQVTIPTAGRVTFAVKVINNVWNRIGAGYSNPCYDPYEVKISRSNGTSDSTGRRIPTSTTHAFAVEHEESVTVTTTAANEVVTISLFGLDAGYWAGNYGPIFKDATLTTPGGASSSSSSGTTTFTVEMTDANGSKTTKTLTFNVASDISITTKSLGNANTGAPYSQELKASGGSGTLRWVLASGTLPTGLSLSTNGVISGTVAETATSQTISISVIDSNTATVTQSYTLNVLSGVPGAPTSLTAGTIGSGRVPLTWTPPTDTGGSALTGYIVSYSSGAGTANDGEAVTEDRGSVSVPVTGLTFPYSLTGLKNGRSYTITVSAKNIGATSVASNAVTVVPAAAAGPPTQLSTVLSNGGITVKWKKPTNSGGLRVDTYTVQCGESATVMVWTNITVRQDTDENGVVSAIVDSNSMSLTQGASYFCRVRVLSGVNGVNFEGEWATTSTALRYLTIPSIPSITTVDTSTATTIGVTFNQSAQDGGSGITSYVAAVAKIKSDGSLETEKRSCSVNRTGETWTAGSKTCTISGVSRKGSFALEVVAVNAIGQSEADTETVTIPGQTQILTYPNTDTNTAYTASTKTYAKIIGESDFPINVTTNSGLKLNYTNNNTTVCEISASGTIRIKAIGSCQIVINQNGKADDGDDDPTNNTVDSDWEAITGTSESVTVTVVGATPSNPSWVSVTPGNQRLTTVWKAPEGRFSAVTDYVVEFKKHSAASWTTFADGTSTETSTAITGLDNGDSYTVRVTAKNSSLASQAVQMPGTFIPASVPDTPTVSSVVVYSDSSTALITWSAVAGNGAPVLGYTVSGTSDSATAVSCSTGASTYSCLIGGLQNKNDYTFRVTARNSIGNSASSDSSTVTVSGVSQTISLNTTPQGTGWSVGDPDMQLDAATSSGLPIQYSVVNSAICTVSSTGLVHFVSDGTCQVYLDQDGTNSSSPNGTQTKFSPATRVGSVDMVVAPARPSTPTITSVTNSNAGLVIAWSASSSGGGTITYTVTGTATGQTTRTCATTSLTCTISTVTKGVQYGFRVQAENSIDSSTASAEVVGTWLTVPSVPTSSSTTSVASTTDGKALKIYWGASASTGGTGDQILSYTATATNATYGSATCTVNRSSSLDSSGYGCEITGLRAGAAYVVTARALNIIGQGETLTIGTLTPGLTQTITLNSPTATTMSKNFGDADFQLDASISSGNTASYSTSSTACSVSPTGVVHILSAGSCVISVSHAGPTDSVDSQYKSVTETITITIAGSNPSQPVITQVAPASQQLRIVWTAPSSSGGSALTYVATATNGASNFSCPSTSSTSCTITGLTDEVVYTVTVTATNANSLTSTSASASGSPFTNARSPMPLLANGGTASVAVSWDSPTASDGTITGYRIYYKASGASSFTSESFTATTFSKTFTGLTAATTYEFYAVALVESATVTSEGNETRHVFATTNSAPTAPLNINISSTYSVSTSTDTATVSWSPPLSNGGASITGYIATATYNGTSSTCSTNGSATTCAIGGLTPGVSYSFSVTASNAVGTSSAVTGLHTTVAPALAPTLSPVVINSESGTATISWTAPSNDGGSAIRSYVVTAYNASTGVATSYGCTAPAGTLTCTVTGLPYKTSLKFAVSAVTLAGTGAASSFSDPINMVLTQSVTFESITAQSFSTGSRVLSAISSSGLAVTFTSVYTDICTVSNGIAYFAKIGNCSITASQPGDSKYSPATSVTQEFVINPSTPTAVTLLQVAPGASQLRATWTQSPSLGGSTLKNYIVSWAQNTDFSDAQSLTTSDTSTVISGLDARTAYLVRVAVASNDASDNSDWSNRLTAQTFGVPDAPTSVAASSPNAGAVTITWVNVPDTATGGTPITGYRVNAFVSGTDASTTFVCTSSGSSCTISGLSGSTNYIFKVTAINAAGSTTSAASNAVRPGQSQTLSVSAISTSHAAISIPIGATASSGLPISYSISSESSTAATSSSWGEGRNVCRVDSSGNLTVDLAGTCVIAVNQDGTNNGADTSYLSASEVTAEVTVTGNAPSVVSSLEALAGSSEIQVNWSAPTDDGGLPITDYIVTWFRKGARHASLTSGGTTAVTPVAGEYGREVLVASELSSLRKRITDLVNGVTYTIYVQAKNAAGVGPEL